MISILLIPGREVAIKIRIIGGPGRDTYTATGGKVHIYDNRDNDFSKLAGVKKHLSEQSFCPFV